MAHVLRITDNTTTVTFTSGNFYLNEYVPQVSFFKDEPIEESVEVGFTGGISTIRSNINTINRLFAQARNYTQSQTGDRVYVEFDPDTSGTVYRSLLFDAQPVILTDNVLGNQWGAANLELELSWIRQPFWEGPLTQIPLANTSTTDVGTTDSIAVNNRNDASGENFVDIASSDIGGDLPSPLKLEMINATTDAANATDEIYIFHNVYSNPAAFVHTIEGESSTDATSTTDANSSGAAYGAFTWATTDETKIAQWTLSSSDLDDASGGRFSILARFPDVFPYTDAWLRLKLETANSNVLWQGDQVNVAPTSDLQRELSLLDTMRLPPYLEGQTGIKSIILALYGYRSSTDNTINIDYLQLSPISGVYGWKRFKSVDVGIGIDETFIHDDTETPSLTYRKDSSSDIIGEFQEFGGPILLVPNVSQRLIFNTCDSAGAAEVAQSWSVKAWHRPRRSAL